MVPLYGYITTQVRALFLTGRPGREVPARQNLVNAVQRHAGCAQGVSHWHPLKAKGRTRGVQGWREGRPGAVGKI